MEKQAKRPGGGRLGRGALGVVFKIVLPVGVVVLAVLGAKRLIETAPTAPRRPASRQAKLVEVVAAELGSRQVVLDDLMGVVRPARAVELRPQVVGRIEWISEKLMPGGRFAAGEELVRIEQRDFELAVAQRESELGVARSRITEAGRALTVAQRDLALEMGSQSVAQREYEMLEEELEGQDTSLVLRRPQLAAALAQVEAAQAGEGSAQAEYAAAQARLEKARLDLERTVIRSPFAAVVREKLVEVGDAVGVNTALVRLVGTEEFWVEVAVSEQDLKWIEVGNGVAEAGSRVCLYNERIWDAGACREGRVIRRMPGVDSAGRMARLLVAVADPLALEGENGRRPALLVNSYVRAVIFGETVEKVVGVDRAHLRGWDEVWVMSPEGRLEVRQVEVVYRGRDEILVGGGLAAGERIVTSNLSVAVDGMAVRTSEGTGRTEAPPQQAAGLYGEDAHEGTGSTEAPPQQAAGLDGENKQ